MGGVRRNGLYPDRSGPSRGGEARSGKRLKADGGSSASATERILEADDARRALDQHRRTTTARADLARHRSFSAVSPEVGVLDEEAFDQALATDADEALTLLADLTGATDERLRALARRLAGRIVIEVARRGSLRPGGIGRPVSVSADRALGDLDLDSSLDALTRARLRRSAPVASELTVTTWATRPVALALVVDRSGSMHGARLAAAAVAAGAAAWRAGPDHSVIAFGQEALVLKAQGDHRGADEVAADLLRLRGFGPTDLALALRAAAGQLNRSRARRKVVIVLSDGRATTGADPIHAARALPADVIGLIAPAGDADDAGAFARAVGARLTTISGPAAIPDAFAALLDG